MKGFGEFCTVAIVIIVMLYLLGSVVDDVSRKMVKNNCVAKGYMTGYLFRGEKFCIRVTDDSSIEAELYIDLPALEVK